MDSLNTITSTRQQSIWKKEGSGWYEMYTSPIRGSRRVHDGDVGGRGEGKSIEYLNSYYPSTSLMKIPIYDTPKTSVLYFVRRNEIWIYDT